MEKYEWYCPLCHTYHYQYISYWNPKKCKNCHYEFFVNKIGEVKGIYERGF